MAAPLLFISVFAFSAAWLIYALPTLLFFTESVLEACQSLLVMCVEFLSLGKLAFFWSGAILLATGFACAAFRAISAFARTRRAVRQLPVHYAKGGLALIKDESVRAAFTYGLLKPRVYISTGLLNILSSEEAKAVLLHEINHKKRRDPLRFLALGFLKDAFFYIPAARQLASYSRLKREEEADDAAARSSYGPITLASAILKVARNNIYLPVPSITGSQTDLSGRIRRLVEGKKTAFPLAPRKAAASAAIALFLAASLAMPIYAGSLSHDCTMERCETHAELLDDCKTHCSHKGH
ncbi:MAG: M56 family metallopeptidase [Deltaproteobacteria bacterium]|nr:M56 family metallopeptidase [Deltaproteobacteria bacterium]MBZ0220020.1 M56 family metallopeptidase [Deltaproteobacteria bacterium]